MRRREFIAGLGSAAAWPVVAWAQQRDRPHRVGFLMGYAENDPIAQAQIVVFYQRLRELGWTDGQNVRIDLHFVSDDADLVRTKLMEVLDSTPDIIVVNSNLPTAAAVKATRTIPIVFISISDPVGQRVCC